MLKKASNVYSRITLDITINYFMVSVETSHEEEAIISTQSISETAGRECPPPDATASFNRR
eukprot:scaffold7843_cov47-Attheya_sp.AAC.3